MNQNSSIPFCYQYKRNYINEKIRLMSAAYGVAFKDAYNTFYAEFTRISKTDIHLLYKTQEKLSKMETLVKMEPEHGFLTMFYNIIKSDYKEFNNGKL